MDASVTIQRLKIHAKRTIKNCGKVCRENPFGLTLLVEEAEIAATKKAAEETLWLIERAEQSNHDPVFYHHKMDSWGFWNETWSAIAGDGYKTEGKCHIALDQHIRTELGTESKKCPACQWRETFSGQSASRITEKKPSATSDAIREQIKLLEDKGGIDNLLAAKKLEEALAYL